jgi:site-specific DNA-methyltransferase (adenine-specific)
MQSNLFTEAEITTVSPAIAKPFVSRSTFYQGDCLVEMDKIEDKSIDAIICDLPYGTTQCKWDSIIDIGKLWEQYKRVIKTNGAIVLTAAQPFTSILVMSNIELFKYSLVWDKTTKTNHLNAKKQPLRRTEDIVLFYKKQCTYNPQGLIKGDFNNYRPNHFKYKKGDKVYGEQKEHSNTSCFTNYPDNVLCFSNGNFKSLHPTQKPVELMEYLIKTYTNEGENVLDNCMGSGTTGVACKKTGRNFIGIEKDEKYFQIAVSRVSAYCG